MARELQPAGAGSKGKARRKRGIVLLVVVSLLALFVLMGVAYAIVASHALHTSQSNQRIQEVGDPPQREVDLILGQILYDTLGRSSLRNHSLLGDLYGGDSAAGTIVAGQAPLSTPTALDSSTGTQPQVWQFAASPATTFSTLPGYYAGRVLTFVSGQAAGKSARIVEYSYIPGDPMAMTPDTYAFAVESPEPPGTGFPVLSINDRFLINGAPFNGAGFGYYPSNYAINATYSRPDPAAPGSYLSAQPTALLPHHSGYDVINGYLDPPGTDVGVGGPDESWDAVDFQNMILAMVVPISASLNSDADPSNDVPIIPSLHRPELVHYWLSNLPPDIPTDMSGNILWNDERTRSFFRSVILRPMPFDHPNFTGSNPAFDRANPDWPLHMTGRKRNPADSTVIWNANQWDVDNDNDGIRDSVWIDPGLPVITSPDGRRYKRLVALLVKDMDGRVSLNEHGTLAQGNPNYRADTNVDTSPWPAGNLPSTSVPSITLAPRGIGYGPAEVNFLNIIGDPTAYGNLLYSRYASAGEAGTAARPGAVGVRDPLSYVKHHGVPDNYTTPGGGFYGWYGSPPDVHGRGVVALDHGGQPITLYMGQAGEIVDNPYEMSHSGEPNNADSPFSVYEGEALLRYHDADAANLPSRPLFPTVAGSYLGGTQGIIGPEHARREMLRTHGASLPVPMVTALREQRTSVVTSGASMGRMTVLDLYRSRLPYATYTPQQLEAALKKIVPWEFLHGQKFDINRWLGDGFDTNGDGTPDDPTEATAENAWQAPASFTGIAGQHTNGTDLSGDGVPGTADNAYARQLYARHLFCLAMLMMPPNFQPNAPHDSTITPAQHRRLVVRRIAQWAINCVDFRDADSIMSWFEYDEYPFTDDDGDPSNGTWEVDGFIGNAPGADGQLNTMDDVASADDAATGYRGYVWGVEYPDLLITETIAFHDRRIKDTNQDSTGDDRDDAPPMNDDDVDQFRVPQGSLFIELYCPRNTYNRNQLLPRELYVDDPPSPMTPPNPRLYLGKVVLGSPVWRLAISPIVHGDATYEPRHPQALAIPNAESASFDPQEVNRVPGGSPNGPVAPPDEFRFAYFTPAAPGLTPNREFFNSAGSNTWVEPGQYVVVGPRPVTYLGSNDPVAAGTTPSLWGGNSPQSIQIGGTGITIVDADGVTTSRTPGTDIRNAVPIVCDLGPGITPSTSAGPWLAPCPWNIGLNFSEPLPLIDNYYPEPMLSVTPTGATAPDFYDDPDAPTQQYPDAPVEGPVGTYPANADRPIAERGMTETGPYTNASSIYLQRLANPNLAFNPNNNPYITVDWATVDLNVFSGEENTDRTVEPVPGNVEPLDPNDNWEAGNQPNDGRLIGSRQRGHMQTAPAADANFWNPLVSIQPENLPGAGATEPYLQYNLSGFNLPAERQTLGFVNRPVGQPQPTPYLGETTLTAANQTSPNLAWHNRPFSSPAELFLVPSSAPSRLCSEITPGTLSNGGYVQTALHYDSGDQNTFRSPFGSLLNFFHTSDAGTTANAAAHLYRILDFVEVPSPYAGAERWYNPNHFGDPRLGGGARYSPLRPPFNKVSQFRDAGKININTIFDPAIWDAAVALFPGMRASDTMAQQVFLSRQGYGAAPLALNGNYPTYFANPFRPADASDLMVDPPGAADLRKQRPADASFLRPGPQAGNAAAFTDQPLFAMNSTAGYNNTARNPYFRYQGYQKLGNLFSTQSNVYAVWMTVGYFEVAPAEYDFNADGDTADAGETWDTMTAARKAAWPDRYMLGPEIGSETGEVVRHRAFFMIDRSVPVGFAPGQKLNTDDCVLLRRLIE